MSRKILDGGGAEREKSVQIFRSPGKAIGETRKRGPRNPPKAGGFPTFYTAPRFFRLIAPNEALNVKGKLRFAPALSAPLDAASFSAIFQPKRGTAPKAGKAGRQGQKDF